MNRKIIIEIEEKENEITIDVDSNGFYGKNYGFTIHNHNTEDVKKYIDNWVDEIIMPEEEF